MKHWISSPRTLVLSAGLIVAMVVGLSVGSYSPPRGFAQGDGTLIPFGEVVQGVLGENGTALYSFDAQAGDIIQVAVLGFDFMPGVELQGIDEGILGAPDTTPLQAHVLRIHRIRETGRHTIVISGGNAGGIFAVSVTRMDWTLSEPVVLNVGDVVQGELIAVNTPIVYSFSTDAGSILSLQVCSLTKSFHPTVLLLTENGELVAHLESEHLMATSLTLEPIAEHYILIVERGAFVETALVEVSLGNAIPAIGCTSLPLGDDIDTAPTSDGNATALPTMSGSETAAPTIEGTLTTAEPTLDGSATLSPLPSDTIEPTLDGSATLSPLPSDTIEPTLESTPGQIPTASPPSK